MNLETGTILQNRYRIVKSLGATTYRAWDSALEQARILQVVPSEGARPIQLAQLHHSHLPRVSDVLRVEDTRLLVVDFVEGQSVNERILERGRPVELARARHWVNQVGDALRYLHQQGMTHGAVSAENIQITPTQDAMLTGYSAENHPQRNDVQGLAAALYTMVTAQPASETPATQHNSKVPSVLSNAILNGIAGKYSTVNDLLTALDQQPEPTRPAPPPGDKTTLLNIDPLPTNQDKTTLLNIDPIDDDKTTLLDGVQQTPPPIVPPAKATTKTEKKRSRLPLIGGLVAVALVLAVAFGLFGRGDDEPSATEDPTAIVADAEVPTEQPAAPTESANEPTAIPTAAPLSGGDAEPTPVPAANDPDPTAAPVVSVGDAQFQQLFTGENGFAEGQIGTLGGLALDETTGTLYVADTNNGLLTINVVTGETQTIDLGLPFATVDYVNIVNPTTLALFSTIGNTGFLVDIESQQLRGTFGGDGTEEDKFRLVRSIASSADGTLYIFDVSQDASGEFVDFIKVFSADGTFQRAISADPNANGSLAIDADGNLYMNSFNSILKFDNSGNLITELGEEALAAANPEEFLSATVTAMTIAADGSIVLTTRDAGIVVLDAQGNLIAQFGEPFEACRDAATLAVGQICDPEAIVVSSDGATILYTDNTYNFGSVNAVQVGR